LAPIVVLPKIPTVETFTVRVEALTVALDVIESVGDATVVAVLLINVFVPERTVV
jgi:hypothetical protein